MAIRRVVRGERIVDPGLALSTLSERGSPLTDRERDVLAASVDGATIRDVAAKLVLSEGTVRNYVSTAIQKLGSRNRIKRRASRKTRAGSSAPGPFAGPYKRSGPGRPLAPRYVLVLDAKRPPSRRRGSPRARLAGLAPAEARERCWPGWC